VSVTVREIRYYPTSLTDVGLASNTNGDI